MNIKQVQITHIPEFDEVLSAHLIEESLSQGFQLVETLVQEYHQAREILQNTCYSF